MALLEECANELISISVESNYTNSIYVDKIKINVYNCMYNCMNNIMYTVEPLYKGHSVLDTI